MLLDERVQFVGWTKQQFEVWIYTLPSIFKPRVPWSLCGSPACGPGRAARCRRPAGRGGSGWGCTGTAPRSGPRAPRRCSSHLTGTYVVMDQDGTWDISEWPVISQRKLFLKGSNRVSNLCPDTITSYLLSNSAETTRSHSFRCFPSHGHPQNLLPTKLSPIAPAVQLSGVSYTKNKTMKRMKNNNIYICAGGGSVNNVSST